MWNLSMKQTDTDSQTTENKGSCQGEGVRGSGIEWKFGISRCKLECVRWINDKVLMYSTGNYN